MANTTNVDIIQTANTFNHWRIRDNLIANDVNEIARGDFTKPTGNVIITEGFLRLANASGGVVLDVKDDARIDNLLSVDTIETDDDGHVYFDSPDIQFRDRRLNSLYQANINTKFDSAFVSFSNATVGLINVNTYTLVVNTANTLFQNNDPGSTLNVNVYSTTFYGTNVAVDNTSTGTLVVTNRLTHVNSGNIYFGNTDVEATFNVRTQNTNFLGPNLNFSNTSVGTINVDNRIVQINTPNVILTNTSATATFNVFPNTYFHGGTVNIANTELTSTVNVHTGNVFLFGSNVTVSNTSDGSLNVDNRLLHVTTPNTIFANTDASARFNVFPNTFFHGGEVNVANTALTSTVNVHTGNVFLFGQNVTVSNTTAGSLEVDNRVVKISSPNVVYTNTDSSATFNVFPNTFFHGGSVNVANTTQQAIVHITPNTTFFKNVTVQGTEDVISDFRVNTNKFTVTASSGDTLVAGDLTVQGGDIISSTAQMNLINSTATTVNFANAATTLRMGAGAGVVFVGGDLQVEGNDIRSSTGAAALSLSAADVTVNGDLTVSGGDIISTATANIANTSATAVNLGGGAATVRVGSTSGTTVARNDLTVSRDLTVTANTVVDSGVLFVDQDSNKVSINSGTNRPEADLEVVGNTKITTNLTVGTTFSVGTSANAPIINTATVVATANTLTISGGGGSSGVPNGNVIIRSGGSEVIRVANTGRVGIGTTTPNSTLTVVGNVWMTGGGNVTGTLNVTTGNIVSAFVESLTLVNPIQGQTELGTNSFRLRVGQTTRETGQVGVYLGSPANGNAWIAFDTAPAGGANVWRVTANSTEGTYYTLITMQNVVATTSNTSTIYVAAANTVNSLNTIIGTTFSTLNTSAATQNTWINNLNLATGTINTHLGTINTTFATLNTSAATQNTWISNLNTATGTINSHLGTINTTFGTVNTNITNITNGTTAITLKSYRDALVVNNSVGAANTVNFNTSNWFQYTLTGSAGNRQFTFANAPSSGTGFTVTMILIQDGSGGKTPTWANTIYWAGGQVPPATTSAGARDLWTFTTYDGGSTFLGTLAVKDAR